MSKRKSSGFLLLLVAGLLLVGLAMGGSEVTLASVNIANPFTAQANIDPLQAMPQDMKVNHGKYDNLLTALYEQQLANTAVAGGGTGAGRPDYVPVYGPDVRMSNGSVLGSNQNEFQIAINPVNHLNAIGTSNDAGVAGVGIFVTTDGGQTWASHDASTYGVQAACCDPGVVYGPDGHAYVIILDTSPPATYIIRSSDGGATWQGPSTVITPDRPNIAADPSNANVLYVTYSELTTSDRIKGYKSTDGGVTWGTTFFIGDLPPAAGYEQSSQPEVASNGALYVGYQQYTNSATGCSAGVQNVVARSTDGGATFGYTVLPITQGGACSNTQAGRGIFCINSGGSVFRSRSFPVIGINPANPQHVYMIYSGGDLETAYTCASATGFHSDTLFRLSTDGGVTFSSPLKVNQDGTGKDQYYPWLSVAPDGTLWTGWNDRREDTNDYLSRWYQASSTDEGATWAEAPVADVQTQPSTFIGDYHGLSAQNDRVLGMWFDSRTSGAGDAYTDPGGGGSTATPVTPSPTRTVTPTTPPTFTRTSTATNTPAATNTSTATSTPVSTDTPVNTDTPVDTSTPVPTNTSTSTDTPLPTDTPTVCPIQFTDVLVGSTFYDYVRCLACRGIINGYPDGTFRPNNNVTRGQLSKIVSNSAGFNDPQTTQMFEDVPVGSTFFDYIGRLASRGYIGGYVCGGPGEPCQPGNLPYFRPNNNATRGQITKIDSNAAGYNDPPTGQQFEDIAVGSTFYTYTYRLVTRSIMSGYPCGSVGEPCQPGNLPYFRPNNNATRGQTSKIVSNTFFPNCQTPMDVKR